MSTGQETLQSSSNRQPKIKVYADAVLKRVAKIIGIHPDAVRQDDRGVYVQSPGSGRFTPKAWKEHQVYLKHLYSNDGVTDRYGN